MNAPKFSITVLLIVVIIISAIGLFVTVQLTEMAGYSFVNDTYPIEDTDVYVKYSPKLQNGIYDGPYSDSRLLIKGDFGYDWGAAANGDTLYINEYRTSKFGLMFCDLVKVDLVAMEKEVLFKNTVLRGRCASGELVCLSACMLPSNYPKSNSLCRLYGMTSEELNPEEDTTLVLYIDPVTSKVVYSVKSEEVLTDSFDELYISRTLGEVME